MVSRQREEVVGGKIRLVFHRFDIDVLSVEAGNVELDLSLLAKEDQGLFTRVEALILHRFLDDGGFSAFKEAGEEIDGELLCHCAPPLYAEELCEPFLVELCADDAEATHYVGVAGSDVRLTGNVVEVDPGAVRAGNDALCAQDHAVGVAFGKHLQDGVDLAGSKLLR